MVLGALVDAGLPLADLRAALARLPIQGYEVAARRVEKGFLTATKVDVRVPPAESQAHRHLPEILAMIARSGLPEPVTGRASEAFRRLAAAEAKVHGIPPEQVHFHEVGAIDAIVDVVGSVWGLHALGVEAVYASPVSVGSGAVSCRHGNFVSPAPAALELLCGAAVRLTSVDAELATPTGAAILTTVCRAFGEPPVFRPERVGYGAGDRDLAEFPNALRLVLGELAPAAERDRVLLLETNLDDVVPEVFSHVMPALFAKGALDAWLTPVQMKKGRPGVVLSVLAEPERAAALEELLFRETGTFGVRRAPFDRHKLARREGTVETPFGPVRVKFGFLGGERIQSSPEYEDCARIARERGVPLVQVLEAAAAAGRSTSPPEAAKSPEPHRHPHDHPHPHPHPHDHGHGHHHH
jgi:uncharacterized protein (TIGR00299 family) protein